MPQAESRIVLPEPPAAVADRRVRAWGEPVVIDTYEPGLPDRYPAYLERRVYQGSSGAVYPLPFIDRVSREKTPRAWEAVHLENEYVRLMVLPEWGGRIHVGLDKTRGYDFFYRNEVVKPALVGLAGPWVSGGVEFNWPQHHRPATHLPVETWIEEESDGAVTVWCSDHDPFARMQGMHGIRLRPASALVELRGRLVNRSDDVQSFLWWANVAAEVHDDYQSFFPTDVRTVADHAKRATSAFPAAQGHYYGVDYPARRTAERPDGDRLDWYRNIPVPTSYMCLGSADDFFGGYDHRARAGFVHWADHRIAPGKKQWTWGNAGFGRAWDAHLTDTGGPYVELMAGVFTDNQPDFAFLEPGETKTFSQFWYPIQETGPVHQATLDAAVRLDLDADRTRIAVAVTAPRPGCRIVLRDRGVVVFETVADLAPGAPFVRELAAGSGGGEVVVEHDGSVLVAWRPSPEPADDAGAEAATAPPVPSAIGSVDELFLTGLHLAQYRHATRSPEPYWEEALRRDPGDARCNTALAAIRQREGRLGQAERHLKAAVARLTHRNPNPRGGEAHYRLGLVLARQGRVAEARAAFGKALWDRGWRDAAAVATARLDLAAGREPEDLRALLDRSPEHPQARHLAAVAAMRRGDGSAAVTLVRGTLRFDPLDAWARDLAARLGVGSRRSDADVGEVSAIAGPSADPTVVLDVALEYRSIGEVAAAVELFESAASLPLLHGRVNVAPLALVHRADLEWESGDRDAAERTLARVRSMDLAWCFPSAADNDALERLRRSWPEDPVLASLCGHWFYAAGRREEAVAAWETAAAAGPDPVVLRNLGMAVFNVRRDPERAAAYYARARAAAPDDARLLFEADQLDGRRGVGPAARLAVLEARLDLVAERDDLSVQYVELLIAGGRFAEAVGVLSSRAFQPWEGGEGRVLAAWEAAHLSLARAALAAGDAGRAVECARAAIAPVASLGEARHPLANTAGLHLVLGEALAAAGQDATEAWSIAAAQEGDFQGMQVQAYSEHTAASVRALTRLGRFGEARRLRDGLAAYVEAQATVVASVDYFATSLPDMLLFDQDVQEVHDRRVRLLRSQLAALDDVHRLREGTR